MTRSRVLTGAAVAAALVVAAVGGREALRRSDRISQVPRNLVATVSERIGKIRRRVRRAA